MDISSSEHISLAGQIPVLGLALILCIIGSKLAKRLKVPTVTIYILIGVFLGPTVFNLIDADISTNLSFIGQAALGLILFNIGGEFHRDIIKLLGDKEIKFFLVHAFFAFTIVTIVFYFVGILIGLTATSSIIVSLLLAAISLDAAPPTSLMVIKEFDAKGDLTNAVVTFLGFGTVLAIVLSQSLITIFSQTGVWATTDVPLWKDLTSLIWSIFGSMMLGVGLAFLLGHWQQREKQSGAVLLSVISFIMFAQTISYYLKTDTLIISLVLGIVLVNISNNGREIHAGIKDMGLSVYAIFFVLAGAHIDLFVNLKSIGMLGLAYILIRIFSFITSGYIAGMFFSSTKHFSKYLGAGLLSHAGVALAIVMVLKDIDQPETKQVVSIVTTSIFIFEILGPFALKWSLERSGDIATEKGIVKDGIIKSQITYKQLWRNFSQNTGIKKTKLIEEVNELSQYTVTETVAIKDTAKISVIKKFINECKAPIFPVVDEDYLYLGIISLDKLKVASLDSSNISVIAKNIIGNSVYIPKNATYNQVKDIFKTINMTALPVVDEKTNKLIGIINYKDIILSKKN